MQTGTNASEPPDVTPATPADAAPAQRLAGTRGAVDRALGGILGGILGGVRRLLAGDGAGPIRWLLRTVALLLLPLVGDALLASMSVGTVFGSQQRVTHAQGALAQLGAVESTMAAAGGGVRACILTHDDSYWQPHAAARARIETEMRELRALTADDADARPRVRDLGHGVTAEMAALQTAADLCVAGRYDDAARAAFSDDGRRAADALHQALAEARTAEDRSLARRTAEARATMGGMGLLLAAAIAGNLVLLGCVIYLSWREVARRDQIARERANSLARERRARCEAEEAVSQRDQFLSLASHELRTPLTGMLTGAQTLRRRMLRESALSERDRRALEVMTEQGMRLHTLIEGMLDVSRIESGQLALQRERLDLAAFARRVAEEAQSVEDERRIAYAGKEGPIYVDADPMRLEQVLQNLLHNAVKYSPHGRHIEVRAEVGAPEGDAAGGAGQATGEARLSVRDDGIGIPEASLPHIFGRFYRAPNSDVEHIRGTGLGLYVVREIVARHGGRMEAESALGQGSIFTVVLPLAPPEPPDAADAPGTPDATGVPPATE